MTGTTDASGQVLFDLVDGDYRFRADYLGYQFWSSDSSVPTVLTDVLSIVHSDVTMTVNEAYGSDITALDGIPVYLFTAAGTYMGITAGTDVQGKVTFNLPEADYKVRTDYLSGQFWSADFNATDVTVDIPHGLTTVHVFETDVDLSDVPVYLFTETGAYLGRQERTDLSGIVTFSIPQGTYKFRVDHGDNQIWSDVINVIANEETTAEMDLDVLVSDLTTNPNPVRFDGTAPEYEREKIMLAALGSLTGLFPQLIEGQTTVDRLYFYINDHLGAPRVMTDDAGAVVWRADFKPFGEVVVDPGSIAANNFRFAGQYYDEETGLHYNYHRYYDPKSGRYITPDPIGLSGGINLYAYTANNPINEIDPLGLLVTAIYNKDTGTATVTDNDTGRSVLAPAFSGVKNKYSPAPNGTYTISDFNWGRAAKPHYFAILLHDGRLDDYADGHVSNYDPNNTMANLRFHSGYASHGCVTVPGEADSKDWLPIQEMILNTKQGDPVIIDGKKYPYYGTLTVTGSGYGKKPGLLDMILNFFGL